MKSRLHFIFFTFAGMKRNTLLSFIFPAAITATVITACNLYHTPQKVEYTVNATPQMIGEGKRLTQIMCAPCHYDPATKKLTGIRMEDVPGFIGKVIAKNITNHPEKGIGKYTDGELAYIIRTGVAKDGKIMPYTCVPSLLSFALTMKWWPHLMPIPVKPNTLQWVKWASASPSLFPILRARSQSPLYRIK